MMLDYWQPYSLLLFAAVAGKVQISSYDMSRTFGGVADTDEKTATANSPCDDHNNRALTDRLRDRMVRLTNERSKTVAALVIAQQREHTLALLEREKYEYVNAMAGKMRRLVDNMKYDDIGPPADTCRERCDQQQIATANTRTPNRSCRRLQVFRRLLAAAEVGLMHIETNRKLQTLANRDHI